jgi:metallo-beta-lactamase family protein
MRLDFLGATGTVTGSRYLLAAGTSRVLLDCGLFQGFKQLRLRNWAPLPFEARSLDAVMLSHAHIDHSGCLPRLAREGFRGRIHCTPATLELCRILLPDSARLQEELAEHANRHGWSKHRPALPLYTRADAERALELLVPVDFGRDFTPAPGFRARFQPAGHILGAAITQVTVGGARVVFSGDLGRDDDLLMRAPTRVRGADLLVMESTYGDRLHGTADPLEALGQVVAQTAARGGTLVVPCFAVGRAQALLLLLHRLKARGMIPRELPIYLDSPMAIDVTAAYRRFHAEHRIGEDECEAVGRVARQVHEPADSRALDAAGSPAVILAGSGMATGGRVLHHLVRFAPDPRSAILLAGFQAGGTRGAALAAGAGSLRIYGRDVPVNASVHEIDTLSAHADRSGLLAWLEGFESAPGRLCLTHGEPAAADGLRRAIAERFGWTAEVPDYRDEVELGERDAARARH